MTYNGNLSMVCTQQILPMNESTNSAHSFIFSLFTSYHEDRDHILIKGRYHPAVLQRLIQSLEAFALDGNGGILITNRAFPFHHQRGNAALSTDVVRLLTFSLDASAEQSEFFLCALGAAGSITLCGAAVPSTANDTEEDLFEVYWSFEPSSVGYALDILEAHLVQRAPEQLSSLQTARQDFPLHAPDPDQVLRLSNDLLTFTSDQEQMLTHTHQHLADRLRWQEDQTRMMLHDIRAPLHTLLISLKTLLPQQLDPSGQQELLSVAYDSAQMLQDMLQTTMDAMHLEAGRIPLRYQPLQVAALIQTACEPFEVMHTTDQPCLRRVVPEDLPVLWADRSIIERVLMNLLSNAFKHTARTGEIVIHAQLATDQPALEFLVIDNGHGIPLDAQSRIFDRFFQAREQDRQRGLGIGLYFCRVAVEAHGGRISVISTPDVGSAFKVVLPLCKPDTASG